MDKKRVFSTDVSRSFSRKGQVTVFIIVGILILFAFALFLYITKEVTTEEFSAEGEPVISSVPQTFQPIQVYTENCLTQIAERGLLILGQQGGYIYPDILGEFSSTDPTNSVGINLEPLKVPYWHYNEIPNTENLISFSSLQPELYAKNDPEMSVEAQLSRFVRENLAACLDDYTPFLESGFEIESGGEEVEVRIAENTVNFLLEKKVNAKKGDADTRMDLFFVKIPLRLKHYYEIADQITEAQKEALFLERHGMEVLTAYSTIDNNYFPPVSDIRFEQISRFSWDESELKQKYIGLLASYIPMLRYLGSENFFYDVGNRGIFVQKILDNMVLPLEDAEDLAVTFNYFGWDPYFKTNSDSEGIIKPEHLFVSAWVLTYGQQRFETHYDISYPVLVTLSDDEALDDHGYQFLFALESNIRNNRPPQDGVEREFYPQSVTSLACNEEQKTTEPLKVLVVDSFDQEPLEAVKIGFTIPEFAECDIGETNENGVLESKYPPVYGGVLNFIKEDYLIDFYPVDTYRYKEKPGLIGYSIAGLEPNKVVELHKFHKVNVTIKKKKMPKCILTEENNEHCFFNQGQNLLTGDPAIISIANGSKALFHNYYLLNKAFDLGEDEEVTLFFRRVNGFHDEIRSREFFASVSVEGDEKVTLDLVPGIYEVIGDVMVKKEFTIPEDERCYEGECFTMDGSTTNGYLAGRLEWNTESTYLEITPEDLYTAKEIIFYVPSMDLHSQPDYIIGTNIPTKVVEDIQLFGEIGNLSRESRNLFEPRYVLEEEIN